jgi:LmbE family N-acetylglucosaminyl deacetylase
MNEHKWPSNEGKNPQALLLTAHPDDETIFCGGTLLAHPEWDWHVVCATYSAGQTRYDEFHSAINAYRDAGVTIAEATTLALTDIANEMPGEQLESWRLAVESIGGHFDIVLTHNSVGEYGHPHHQTLNRLAHDRFHNVWEFIAPGATPHEPQPFGESNHVVALDEELLSKKFEIFDYCYRSQANLWRVFPDMMQWAFSTGPEIFTTSTNV